MTVFVIDGPCFKWLQYLTLLSPGIILGHDDGHEKNNAGLPNVSC